MDTFCSDTIDVYIVVSRDDYEDSRIFQSLSTKVRVNLLCFKDLMKNTLHIDIDEQTYLHDCGSFTFQSIKKIIAVYYLVQHYKYIYVIDSEGLYIRPFSFKKIIGNYIKKKRIFYNSKQRRDDEKIHYI